jgi:hypothetical protein
MTPVENAGRHNIEEQEQTPNYLINQRAPKGISLFTSEMHSDKGSIQSPCQTPILKS